MTASSVRTATALNQDGQWVVNLTFTDPGSRQWDSLAQAQFHALVATVVNGQVITAPIVQPMQVTFTSFGGQAQISADFTAQQAQALASRLQA